MNNLKKIRLLRGLTQYELGKHVGLCQTRIWRIENGYEVSSEEMKKRLACILKVAIDDIFSDSEEELNARHKRLEEEQNKIWMDKIAEKLNRMLNDKQ